MIIFKYNSTNVKIFVMNKNNHKIKSKINFDFRKSLEFSSPKMKNHMVDLIQNGQSGCTNFVVPVVSVEVA